MLAQAVKQAALMSIACGTTGVVTYKAHAPIKKAIHKVYHKPKPVRHYAKPKAVKPVVCPPVSYGYSTDSYATKEYKVAFPFAEIPNPVISPAETIIATNTPIGITPWRPGILYPHPGAPGYPGGGSPSLPPTPPTTDPTPPVSILPETSTWAMIILGFGMMGAGMRYSKVIVRKKKQI